MDRLARLSGLLLELHAAARRETPDAFCEWVFARVSQLVPFDSGFWASGYFVPEQGPLLHTWHLHRQPPQAMAEYQAIGPYDTVVATAVCQPGVTLVADSASWAPPQALDYLNRYRIAHTAATCQIDPRTALITGVSLWRADAGQPYTEDERLMIQALFPHLIEARTQNQLQHLVHASTTRQSGPWRAAAADTRGLLHQVDDAFTQLLLREWPDWTGPYLPPALRLGPAHLGARRWAGRQVVARLTPLAELVLVQLRPCTDVDRLTPRELQVAGYTAQGLTHKEIAKVMALAPATVRTHLTSSCRRLGVKSKSQLAALVAGVA